MRIKVRYQVKFDGLIDVENEDTQDAVSGVDIPEGGLNNSVYVPGSFEVLEIEKIETHDT